MGYERKWIDDLDEYPPVPTVGCCCLILVLAVIVAICALLGR
jgi:hypothetical protein